MNDKGERRPEVEPGQNPDLSRDPHFREIASFPVVCIFTAGLYWKLSGTFTRLREWMSAQGVEATGSAIGIFYDDPSVTPPEGTRYAICYPIAPHAAGPSAPLAGEGAHPQEQPVPPSGQLLSPDEPPPGRDVVEHRLFPAGRAAVLEYQGPAAESPRAYERLSRWVEEQGLVPAAPPREVYLAEPGTLGKGMMHVRIEQAVVPEE